jgi:hypothetical protein
MVLRRGLDSVRSVLRSGEVAGPVCFPRTCIEVTNVKSDLTTTQDSTDGVSEVKKWYEVTFHKTEYQSIYVTVEAKDEEEAQEIAEETYEGGIEDEDYTVDRLDNDYYCDGVEELTNDAEKCLP